MLRITTAKGKFALLKRRLHSHYRAVGALESLWHITATNHPDGGIGRMSDEEIEACVEWDGKPGELVAALIATRWLDRADGEARLYVHDWHHHADETTHRKLARECRYFANGSAPNTNYLPQRDRDKALPFYRSGSEPSALDRHAVATDHALIATSRDRSRLDRDQFSSGQGQRVGAESRQEEEQEPAAPAPAELERPRSIEQDFAWILPQLAAKGGDPDELKHWLSILWPEIVAAAQVEAPTPDKLMPAIKKIAHARWRTYLSSERKFRGIAEHRAREERIDAWERKHGEAARESVREEIAQ